MGLLICRFCIEPGVQKNVIILGQSGTGKTIALYQLLDPNLVSAEIKPKLTSVFNNEIVRFPEHRRIYEFWDVSGKGNYLPFWESFYKHIAFNIVIYCIDANKYFAGGEEKKKQLITDKMELHSLLCAEELSRCDFILYLNWGNDNELDKKKKEMVEVIPDDLALFNFPTRPIIVVDSFKGLHSALCSFPTDLEY